jgi:hypothetical protein
MYESEAQENRSWKEQSCTTEQVRARGTELDADIELRHAVDGIVLDALDSTNVELAGVSVELRKVPAPVNVPGALGRRTVRGHEARRARVAENLGRGRVAAVKTCPSSSIN